MNFNLSKTINPRAASLWAGLILVGFIGGMAPPAAVAASVTLAWDANTETNLAGYKIRFGPASGQYSNVRDVGNVVTGTVSNLVEGWSYFVVTAYDTAGLESDPSNVVSNHVVGTPPAISAIADQTALEDYPTFVLPFQVSDLETPAGSLALSATSSNPGLAPVPGVAFGGSGNHRTVRVTPAANQSGTALITIIVTDAGGATASESFLLTVQPVNDPPALSMIANHTVMPGATTPVIPFQVTDPETPAASLILSRTSSNPALVPEANIVLGGSGSSRTVQVAPAPYQTGSAIITLTATDPAGASTGRSFTVTVQATNNPTSVIQQAGVYAGLFHEVDEVRQDTSGSIKLKLKAGGAFSAKLKLAGKSYSWSGRFGSDGRVSSKISRSKKPKLLVDLRLVRVNFGILLQGQVGDGTWVAPFFGDPAICSVTTNCGIFAGTYTMSIPDSTPAPNEPAPNGFAIIRVDQNGTARVSGEMPDGRKFVDTAPVSAGGYYPLYVPLYAGQGSILSWINFTNTPAGSLHGLLSWTKPARPRTRYVPEGLTNTVRVAGSQFQGAASASNHVLGAHSAHLILAGGNLSGVFTNAVTLAAPFGILNDSTNRLAVSINRTTGLLTGSFVDPATRRTHRFRGVYLQEERRGKGYVTGTNALGCLLLQADLE